jgi:hypothetical protein
MSRLAGFLALTLGLLAALPAVAQTPVIVGPGGINQGRDCKFVRFCNGRSNCTASIYACRVCQLVPARCTVGTAGRVCQRMACTWN